MGLITTPAALRPTADAARLAGPDVVRGVALIGVVVMNYHGYLLLMAGGAVGDGWAAMLFDPWRGPLSTRFAATFVLVAGVGVTLLTRSAIGFPERVAAARWRLIRRGVLLYVVGLPVDMIWPGTILPYYGVMFVLAAGLFTLRIRWIVIVGLAATAAATAIRMKRFDLARSGRSTAWPTSDEQSVQRLVFDVFVNGTHPLLPWLAFLCAGIVLGRVLHTTWWRRWALGAGATLIVVAGLASLATEHPAARWADVLGTVRPFDGSLGYATSALGSSLVAYAALDWLAVRQPVLTDPLRRAGQLTLTLYLLHIVVFDLIVRRGGLIEPAGLDTALGFALVFWVAAIACAVVWQRRIGRGPAECVYRAFGG